MTRAAPPFAYYGGKTRVAQTIASYLPPHAHYVEPFAGGLSVLLAKPRSKMETVNDLNRHLVTFWRVVRDRPDELAQRMARTPHSIAAAEEAEAVLASECASEMAVAAAIWTRLAMRRAGNPSSGMRQFYDAERTSRGMPAYLSAYIGRVPKCAERLVGVSLECRDALGVIADYGQAPSTCLYVDPPYLSSTRSSVGYTHELGGEDEHRALLEALLGCKAAVVLSGYASHLYDEMLAGWDRVEISATADTHRSAVGSARTEVLWINRPQHLTLWGT